MLIDEHIGEIAESSFIRNDPRKTDLFLSQVNAEAEGARNRSGR